VDIEASLSRNRLGMRRDVFVLCRRLPLQPLIDVAAGDAAGV